MKKSETKIVNEEFRQKEAFEKIKHNNRKEILSIKDNQFDKIAKRKVDYMKLMYDLKTKYLEKEEDLKIRRIKIAKALM